MNYSQLYEDGWAGTRLVVVQETDIVTQSVYVSGFLLNLKSKNARHLDIILDDVKIGNARIASDMLTFEVSINLTSPLPPGQHKIEIQADWWFVPYRLSGVPDYRPLSWRFYEVTLR